MDNNKKGVQNMSTTAQKWGNSLGIRLPKSLAEKHGVVNGSQIEFHENKEEILIKPVEKNLSLEEMLAQITDENRHDYIDFGRKRDELI